MVIESTDTARLREALEHHAEMRRTYRTHVIADDSPILKAATEHLKWLEKGEKVWWCKEHRSSVPDGNEPDGTCERSMSEWESAYPGFRAKPCRMVEKLLITQQRGVLTNDD